MVMSGQSLNLFLFQAGLVCAVLLPGLSTPALAQNEPLFTTIVIDQQNDSCVPVSSTFPTCAEACEAEPKGCAEDILAHVNGPAFVQRRVLQPALEPGTRIKAIKPNIQTPMHGLFVTIFVNDIADHAIRNAIDNPFEPTEMPPWSFVVKYNEVPTDDITLLNPWETHMYKIPGYCPQRAVAAPDGACVGGEWFYLLYRNGALLSFQWDPELGSVPAWGKATGFCIECHGAVEDSDWLWLTHDFQNRNRQLAVPFRFDGETPGNTGSGQCDDVTALSPVLPPDVALDPNKVPAPGSPQRMFDCFAWESFIALSWPASETQRGQPDVSAPFGKAEGNRVWETYQQVYETFQASDPEWTLDGRSFNDPQPMPDVCQAALNDNPSSSLNNQSLAFQVLNERHQAYGNQFNTLVDQNGNRVRFNIRFNEPEWKFIQENGYADTGTYDYNGPADSATLTFPDNQTPGFDIGAIEIKSAWKELCTTSGCNPVDDPARYYARDAFIYQAAIQKTEGTQPETCRIAQVGLVGLHLVSKTFWAPQWTWATFEHIDNVPDVDEVATLDPFITPNPYSLFNPICLAEGETPSAEFCLSQRPGVFGDPEAQGEPVCCTNLQVIQNSSPDPENTAPFDRLVDPNFTLMPAQVTRIDPIETHAAALNPIFQNLLREAGSPFQYYQLITSQWALNGRLSGDSFEPFAVTEKLCLDGDTEPCFTLEPDDVPGGGGRRLRNTTMETFQVSYCLPDDQDISNDPADCTPEDVVHDPVQSSSAGCINCHFSAGTDSSFVWTDAVLAGVPLTSGAEPGSGLVFRFLNLPMGTHFYTASVEERDSVIDDLGGTFGFEGIAFGAALEPASDTVEVFRFLNTITGTHFYTASESERAAVEALGFFSFEGVAYLAFGSDGPGRAPLFRFFNTGNGTHFYTANEEERDIVLDTRPDLVLEGVAYFVDVESL